MSWTIHLRVALFYEFDSISERIRHIHTLQAGQRYVSFNGVTRDHTADEERRESFDSQRRMGLTSRAKVGLDPEVQLHSAAPEPYATSTREHRGLGYFLEPQHVAVEPAGCLFTARRHGELHVVYADNAHRHPPKPDWLPTR
jgi:hypothetical protein